MDPTPTSSFFDLAYFVLKASIHATTNYQKLQNPPNPPTRKTRSSHYPSIKYMHGVSYPLWNKGIGITKGEL